MEVIIIIIMAAGIKRLYSDEYNAATAEMFDYLKMASKFPIGHFLGGRT